MNQDGVRSTLYALLPKHEKAKAPGHNPLALLMVTPDGNCECQQSSGLP